MTHTLLEWAKSRGCLVAWGPLSVLDRARADLERRRESGELEPSFARDNLSFAFLPESFAWADAVVLVVAVPRPAHSVGFSVGGRLIETLLPPTYHRYRALFEDVRRDLLANALPGWAAEHVDAPVKAVATRLGLVRYGRNNIAYVPGFGSYVQLLCYVTNAPLPVALDWTPREPELLEECTTCGLCEALCPTGAITDERVLLRAERCLTLANESTGTWPPWVPPQSHHCLLGCLSCQRECPANPALPVENSSVVFTEEETSYLLGQSGGDDGPVRDSIRGKLDLLGRPDPDTLIARNLRALVSQQLDATETGPAQTRRSWQAAGDIALSQA